MDPRLKERLIGAAVLVALGVVFVPWVLDGPDPVPAPSSADLQLPPPDEAEPLRVQTIELGRSDDAPAPVAKRDAGAGAAAARPDSAAPSPPATRPPEPAGQQAAATPEPRKPSPDPKAAPSATAGQHPAPAAGQWAVQLGAFGEEENARRLAARVATFGFDADVSTYRSGGREMYRVRTSPQKTRERAEAAASSLTAHGFVAQVVSAN